MWLWPVSRKCVCIHPETEDIMNNGEKSEILSRCELHSSGIQAYHYIITLYFVPLHSDYKIHTGSHITAYRITLHTLVVSTI